MYVLAERYSATLPSSEMMSPTASLAPTELLKT